MAADAAAAGGQGPSELRVDGGACVNDLLMQFQADLLGIPVVRPQVTETTALGAAYLAGLAEGVWSSTDDTRAMWQLDARFEPGQPSGRHDTWRRAVERSLDWARD